MKKSILLIAIISIALFASNSFGQITVDHVYTTDPPFKAFKIGASGIKYFAPHYQTNSVIYFVLYNPDYSIYKTINVPQIASNLADRISFVSETLFDPDTLIEYMLYYQPDTSHTITDVRVLNENGVILLNADSSNFTASSSADPYQGYINQPIFPNGNQTKLYLYRYDYSATTVYNLPGQLPCLECDNGVVTGFIENPQIINQTQKSIAYPNPFMDAINIKYTLPGKFNHAFIRIYDITGKLIKKKEIDNNFNEVIITSDEIKQGAYMYQIVADEKVITSDKIIRL